MKKYIIIFLLILVSCSRDNNLYNITITKKTPSDLNRESCDFLNGNYNKIKRMTSEEKLSSSKQVESRRANPAGKRDTDKDGIKDVNDNCPLDFNPDQKDTDGDGIGDACDLFNDRDKDGIRDDLDNCPFTSNPDQLDSDKDGIGDVCDPTPYSNIIYDYTILLDFDGQYVSSPYWNGGFPFYADSSSLSPTEILNIVTEVKKDFDAWKVNITTDTSLYNKTSPLKRQRIIITSSSSWFGNAGGVAYIGSITWGLDVPAFVFSNLLSYNQKYIWEATSHESGHTVGLYHQSSWDLSNCNFLAEYRNGTIMGVGYYTDPVYWTIGPTSMRDTTSTQCGRIQNDTLIINSVLPKK